MYFYHIFLIKKPFVTSRALNSLSIHTKKKNTFLDSIFASKQRNVPRMFPRKAYLPIWEPIYFIFNRYFFKRTRWKKFNLFQPKNEKKMIQFTSLKISPGNKKKEKCEEELFKLVTKIKFRSINDEF